MAPSRASVTKTMYAALQILKDNGGEMSRGELIEKIKNSVSLSDWEKEIPPQSKYNTPRWIIFFDAVSGRYGISGYIIKKGGVWYLTEEGEKAFERTPDELYTETKKAYNEYRKAYILEHQNENEEEIENDEEDIYSVENLITQANEEIRVYIDNMSPYDFQELIAALLRAMGYYTPFIAPRGRDGGIDIVAYQDALGTKPPRIKVQVKHYDKDSKISVDVVRALIGQLKPSMDVGIIVTTSNFTADAQIEARSSEKNIRLIDGEEFIQLWLQYYESMPAIDKEKLPLVPVYKIKKGNL